MNNTFPLSSDRATARQKAEQVAAKLKEMKLADTGALVANEPEAYVDLFRRDQSDFDGTFLLPGAIPGKYPVVAVENACGFEWLKVGVRARYVPNGQNVIIGEKIRGTLSLPEAVEVQGR